MDSDGSSEKKINLTSSRFYIPVLHNSSGSDGGSTGRGERGGDGGPFSGESQETPIFAIFHNLSVLFLDSKSEASFLFRKRSPRKHLGLPLTDNVFPFDGCAIIGIHEAVVVGEAEGDGARIEAAREAEAGADDGGGATEIELDGVVELVGVDTVDLGDVIVAVGGELVEEAVEELEGGKPELWREDCLQKALTKSPHPHH
ncbi:Uncharacterized protein Fot_03712 [Forsythia ovata]|uniref:Uncharacterized protein n=1 Tax=Forsythia ovata TaxID=205694 RepID=A0ABD1XAH3_9LAMI